MGVAADVVVDVAVDEGVAEVADLLLYGTLTWSLGYTAHC